MGVFAQTSALTKKNILLARRNTRTTTIKLLIPILCLLACILLTNIVPVSIQKINTIKDLPKCNHAAAQKQNNTCNTLMFSPNIPPFTTLMQIVGESNNPSLSLGVDIVPSDVPDYATFANYMFNFKRGVTQGGVFFTPGDNETITYTIVYNETYDGSSSNRYNIQVAIDRAILKYYTGNQSTLKVSTQRYPSSTQTSNVLQLFPLALVYIALTVLTFSAFNGVVSEANISRYLRCFGLLESSHSISWFAYLMFNNLIITILFLGLVYCFPSTLFFHRSNFFVHFLNFSLYGASQIAFSLFLSTFVTNLIAANILASMIFFGGLAQVIFTLVSGPTFYQWWSSGQVPIVVFFRYAVQIFPFFHFTKVNLDITNVAVGFYNNGAFFGSTQKFGISLLGKSIQGDNFGFINSAPSPIASMGCMFVMTFIYLFLAWYMGSVINGKRFYFCFSASYWKSSPTKFNRSSDQKIQVSNLSKKYRNKPALDNVSFQFQSGVMVVLGRNGAGKTTLVDILSGFLSPSSGTATINGCDIVKDMGLIRPSIGVCLQSDVFWLELSAEEHLSILSTLKGVEDVKAEVARALSDVKLTKVANNPVQTFSGGMKRRLSVALSTVGDPSIILLDEPTTGIDVVNQKFLWEAINEIKRKGALIIMVSHSDEEANAVADRIILINEGQVRIDGTPAKLKSQYGVKTVHILTDVSKCDEVKASVTKILPEAKLIAENAGSILYAFADISKSQSIDLFQFFQQESSIKDWNFTNARIDSNFMNLRNK